jgi:hypothetical protein
VLEIVHPSIKLVSPEVVATIRGISRESLYEQSLAGGLYRWVFNVGSNPARERELRFWARELKDPAAVRTVTIKTVIDQILPPGPPMSNLQVCDLLRVTRPHLFSLRAELQGKAHNNRIFFARTALVKFFQRRWICLT